MDRLLLASCVIALLGSDKKRTTSCTLKCTRNRKRDTVLQKETDWLQAFPRADFVAQHPGTDVALQIKNKFSILFDGQ